MEAAGIEPTGERRNRLKSLGVRPAQDVDAMGIFRPTTPGTFAAPLPRERLGLLPSAHPFGPPWREPTRRTALISVAWRATGRSAWKRPDAALLQESETSPPFPCSEDFHQAPIAKDSGRPSSVIRFRMLHAISASAACDLG